MQEGQTGPVITPGGSPDTPNWQYNANPQSQPGQPPANLPPVAPTPLPAVPSPPPNVSPPQAQPNNQPAVSWTASEFIAHHKPSGWYGLLTLASLAIAAVVYLITKDKISTGVILFVALIFGFSAARKPRELHYGIDDKGVYIDKNNYAYNSFRSFSIVQEEGIESIWLMPLKRFKPVISIYFDPKDGDRIVDILSQFLPVENHQLDAVDRLMHRLRF